MHGVSRHLLIFSFTQIFSLHVTRANSPRRWHHAPRFHHPRAPQLQHTSIAVMSTVTTALVCVAVVQPARTAIGRLVQHSRMCKKCIEPIASARRRHDRKPDWRGATTPTTLLFAVLSSSDSQKNSRALTREKWSRSILPFKLSKHLIDASQHFVINVAGVCMLGHPD